MMNVNIWMEFNAM